MSYEVIDKSSKRTFKPGEHYITVTHGMSGFFAVEIWINPGSAKTGGSFPEPWDTGFGRYPTKLEAEEEARDWAKIEELPYVVSV
jgi:hypothetical protein